MPDVEIPRCDVVILTRTSGMLVTVCLTCPTRRGYNARWARQWSDMRDARRSVRDHVRAKARYRAALRRYMEWRDALIDAPNWETYREVIAQRFPTLAPKYDFWDTDQQEKAMKEIQDTYRETRAKDTRTWKS